MSPQRRSTSKTRRGGTLIRDEYLLAAILRVERPSLLISTIRNEGFTRPLIKNSCFVLAATSRCRLVAFEAPHFAIHKEQSRPPPFYGRICMRLGETSLD